MIDVCFVGNSSIDLISSSNVSKRVYGGSAIYSAFACRSLSNKKIGIISNVNTDLKKELDSRNIMLFGNILKDINSFEINEDFGTCVFLNEIDTSIDFNQIIEVDYLHVSFRKGVDVDNIINNSKIKFNHLSIDVMIHSVDSYIEVIKKYIEKIELIFCNSEEYKVLKEKIISLPKVIVTNEDKSVIVVEKNKNISYNVPQNVIVTSSTGAGDTFIGGFLSEYSSGQNIDKSVSKGISIASYSVTNFGPIDKVFKVNYIANKIELPKNIIVIGNSCAGKTTFVNYFKSLYSIYTDIDDLAPLSEMFMIDDVSLKNDFDDFKELRHKIIYMDDIYEEYLNDFSNIKHYSITSNSGNGHDIINPKLWDIILKKSIKHLKNDNNIIQFSRGKDKNYEKMYGDDVYGRSLKIIMDELDNKSKTIIINVVSDLEIRKKRNRIRFEKGGHFVSEDTMNNVYKDDIFKFEKIDLNRGFIIINNKKYPVYTINNNRMMSSVELNNYLQYNVDKILEYYKKNQGGKYEY